MTPQGFLIISDITGYSKYVNESELEHARDSLTDLLNILIQHTQSPLVISKLEGDAVFSYAPAGGFLQGQSLLDMIETTYASFRKALELMVLNTTCPCNACRNLPNLDLKFFVHFGSYMTQKLGNFTELVGNDVNLVHRLAKNRIKAEMGFKAYAAFTQAVILLDDIGYVQQSREEMEVLFTFLAERYERRSVVITSNLIFSEWDKIFKDPLTTAAAIDRVVHHAMILEFGAEVSSYRAEQAAQRNQKKLPPTPPPG
jgi:hypothetical protein